MHAYDNLSFRIIFQYCQQLFSVMLWHLQQQNVPVYSLGVCSPVFVEDFVYTEVRQLVVSLLYEVQNLQLIFHLWGFMLELTDLLSLFILTWVSKFCISFLGNEWYLQTHNNQCINNQLTADSFYWKQNCYSVKWKLWHAWLLLTSCINISG